MSGYRWLHLTDLHFRMPGQASLWPNMETVFFQDLELLHEKVGAWDLVLFTGDLTYSGSQGKRIRILRDTSRSDMM
jgi:3',5'-cyclic AMP phosphodiesterase CpdA